MFSLDNITKEARPIIMDVAKIYHKHTKSYLKGIIVHGSAVIGDYIPGCSDIDVKLLLDSSKLPLNKYFEIHKELSQVNVHPFRYVQCDIMEEIDYLIM